ncbi:MAG: adenosylhomocysteinase [Chloroflexi bacterium]|nr:adenosylhomocysteinase [Chloroflexota bacterium]|tara:strand:- start:4366 stop:5655 length:1290 start_codon:yes stop_codon:yes gene_type:complete
MSGNNPKSDIKNIDLASEGGLRAEWASREMPVLRSIKERFLKEKPLEGIKISGCLHITAETANLVDALSAGGANVSMCASNPLSTQDDIAAYLVSQGISVFAIYGEDEETYDKHLEAVLDEKPHLTIDDGADLVAKLHGENHPGLENIIGSMEETTTGIIRLKALSSQGKLKFPVIAVNDSDTKHMFDNRYGTGQSTLDGIIRATNILITGKAMVIVGYGWCGRGLASRAKGMGARTIVCEVDSVKALEAIMDGHEVMKMEEASKIGDIFVTVTGGLHAVDKEHFESMKSGAIVANSGHFNVELNLEALDKMTESKRRVRDNVEEYTLETGKLIFVLGEGRLVNLAAAEGHPPSVMDMSFANQALASEHIVKNYKKFENQVYTLPKSVDQEIASLKIKSMNMGFDTLKDKQDKYLNSWELGTGSSQENL